MKFGLWSSFGGVADPEDRSDQEQSVVNDVEDAMVVAIEIGKGG
jgi:hypothetical protein